MKVILLGLLLVSGLCGCTVVSANRVFPKVDWYWSRDAKAQRQYDEWERRENVKEHTTQAPTVLPDRTLSPGEVCPFLYRYQESFGTFGSGRIHFPEADVIQSISFNYPLKMVHEVCAMTSFEFLFGLMDSVQVAEVVRQIIELNAIQCLAISPSIGNTVEIMVKSAEFGNRNSLFPLVHFTTLSLW